MATRSFGIEADENADAGDRVKLIGTMGLRDVVKRLATPRGPSGNIMPSAVRILQGLRDLLGLVARGAPRALFRMLLACSNASAP